jgi:hypothetical protein
VTFTGTSTARFALPIPNESSLIDLDLHLQAWSFAPGYNQGNTIVSGGVSWGIGNV